jgi:hypothetical protein
MVKQMYINTVLLTNKLDEMHQKSLKGKKTLHSSKLLRLFLRRNS